MPHEPPAGIVPEENLFFITICSENRNSNELLDQARPKMILDAVIRRHEQGIWYARIFIIMPDHVHGLIHFSNPQHPMKKAVLDFKRWTARSGGFHWQRDFFDHRLRQDESTREKANYILMNPVRAGLCASPEIWPHRFIAIDALG